LDLENARTGILAGQMIPSPSFDTLARPTTLIFCLLFGPLLLTLGRSARSEAASFLSFFLGDWSMPRLRRHKCASFHPSIEALELRCVPTTITPTTFADVLGSGSLRDAVLR
jgi:hypothetical protein